MPTFEPYTAVAVPFPYVERATTRRRPALVISPPKLVSQFGLLWIVMITSTTPSGPDFR